MANGINPNKLNHFLFLGSTKNRLKRITANMARIARSTSPIFFNFMPSFKSLNIKIIFALIITKKGTFLHTNDIFKNSFMRSDFLSIKTASTAKAEDAVNLIFL